MLIAGKIKIMTYRIMVLVCAFFLWGGCKDEDLQIIPDSDDYKRIEIKGNVLSYADQQPIANVRIVSQRCGIIAGDCFPKRYLGLTGGNGQFEFVVDFYYWHNNYLRLEGIDSSYESGGYVNSQYVSNLLTGGILLHAPSSAGYTNSFKIELVKK